MGVCVEDIIVELVDSGAFVEDDDVDDKNSKETKVGEGIISSFFIITDVSEEDSNVVDFVVSSTMLVTFFSSDIATSSLFALPSSTE